jgi:hypothetical protein
MDDRAKLHRVHMIRAPKTWRIYQFFALVFASLLLLSARGASGLRPAASQTGKADPTATLPAKWQGDNPGAGVPTVAPLASISPRPLPAFSDPRVAYIGPDSLLHVVSLDGRFNQAGTPIPLVGFVGDSIWAAGTSPMGNIWPISRM